MKAGLLALAAASLAHLAAAQPHRHGRRHQLKHDRLHAKVEEKRDESVLTDYVTVTASEVVVWVDEHGSYLSAETKGVEQSVALPPSPTPSSQPPSDTPPSTPSSTPEPTTPAPSSPETPPATTDAPPPPPPSSSPEAPPPPPPSSSAPPPAQSSGTGSGNMIGGGKGVCYTPYADNGDCKDQGTISNDFDAMSAYNIIRIYGVDCNQVSNVMSVAHQKNKQVMLGIIDIKNVNADIGNMVSQVGGNWNNVYAVVVGNEVVNNGQGSADDVANAIQTARGILQQGGYQGPVVAVDTQNAIIANPKICQASDFPAANIHAFFNANLGDPSGAGDWVASQAKAVSDACGGKKVLVTESGWPTAGCSGGQQCPNEPSQANQAKVLESLRNSAIADNLFMFSGGSTQWKQKDPGPFGVEPFWRMLSA
ncbi:MAG: hypothetical protein Q9160_000321 [Pyrenula sp. 1 TL-2023]